LSSFRGGLEFGNPFNVIQSRHILVFIFEIFSLVYLWHEENFPGKKASLVKYVASYLQKQQGDELKAYADAYRVNVIPYDWRLNDKNNAED